VPVIDLQPVPRGDRHFFATGAHGSIGNPDLAIADFEAVLRIEPNNATARQGPELARRQRGR